MGWALAVAGALLAAAMILAATRLGVGATPDSGHYLATADSVVAGRGYVRMGPEVMASWPPLYPTLLAALRWAGIDPLAGVRILNALLLGGLTLIAASWIYRRTGSLVWTAVTALALALGPPLVYAGSLALSDLPFVFLSILSLRLLDAWLDRGTPALGAACAAVLALACLTRYNGVVLVAAACLCVLAFSRGSIVRRLSVAAAVGLAAAVPLALWLARNYALTGRPAGPRFPSERGAGEHAVEAGYTVMSWFVPYRILTIADGAGAVLLAGLLLAMLALAWFRRDQPGGRVAVIAALFAASFTTFMVITSAATAMDALTHRMMAPAYAPIVIAAGALGAIYASAVRARWWPAALVLAVLPVLGVAAARTVADTRDSWRNGPGGVSHSNFNTPAWRDSPSLRWAAENLDGKLLFASSPAALYLATGEHARPMPRKHARRNEGVPMDDLDAIRRDIAGRGEAYLIVNRRAVPTNVFEVSELDDTFDVIPVRTFPDGVIYRLRVPDAF